MDTRITPPSPPNRPEATVAFVVPWHGDDARGGAELQAWETAMAMAEEGFRVEVLTTCSRSFLHRWDDNYYPPGVEERRGVTVRRFSVDRRDEALFGAANRAILSRRRAPEDEVAAFVDQNINSGDLYRFIAERAGEYVFIFVPYLYGTTLRGALIHPERSLVMPCFHDEPYAYLEAVRRVLRGVRGMIYLTPEEAGALAAAVDPNVPGEVVGGGIAADRHGQAERFRAAAGLNVPFVLSVGRLDRGKNTHQLLAYHQERRRRGRSREALVLIGNGDFPLPADDPSVIRLQAVDNAMILDACAAALTLAQPSVNESFSRVIMESWLNETPVMVNAACAVTKGHCRRGGGGLWFSGFHEYEAILDLYHDDDALRRSLGASGRRYVLENCRWDAVVARLVKAVTAMTGLSPATKPKGLSVAN